MNDQRKRQINDSQNFRTDRVLSYFKVEWKVLLAVTISGLIYNVGLLAGPWFEGKMTGCLLNILNGSGAFADMRILVIAYVVSIAIVQTARYIKRFYVTAFCQQGQPADERNLVWEPGPQKQGRSP